MMLGLQSRSLTNASPSSVFNHIQARSACVILFGFIGALPMSNAQTPQDQVLHEKAPEFPISHQVSPVPTCAQLDQLQRYSWQAVTAKGNSPDASPTPSAQDQRAIPAGEVKQGNPGAHDPTPFSSRSSVYIPADSWMYPALLRLYSLGYVDSAFLNMRPWTRNSVYNMLLGSQTAIQSARDEEALEIYDKLLAEFRPEHVIQHAANNCVVYGLSSLYTRALGISGTPLNDSFHLGQTLVNDYGRPFQSGFNTIIGSSEVIEYKHFSLYVRGEYQHSPSAAGFSNGLFQQLSGIDQVPIVPANQTQATIPRGPLAAHNPYRLLEATVSAHYLGHEFSFGKSDAWLGPGLGGSMAWSNNAENIYSFRINRVEPLKIPLLSRVLGPVRYDFFVGSLKGHTDPNDPWIHSDMFAFSPTTNFQFGFQRTVIWGGHGHVPITIHTFLRSFFSLSDTSPANKVGRGDPGARFSTFNFSWRLPYARKYLTLYTDAIAHDDVTPISAPRRAAYRTGIYLAQVPGLHKLDLRVEASMTDPPVMPSMAGRFNYWETIQHQGYTNKGFLLGDWMGREAKGGQAWLTYHLSGTESVQLEYLNKKNAKDFIPGGTTQNQVKLSIAKRLQRNIDLDAWAQYERWKAPIYLSGPQSNTAIAVQITWHPSLMPRDKAH